MTGKVIPVGEDEKKYRFFASFLEYFMIFTGTWPLRTVGDGESIPLIYRLYNIYAPVVHIIYLLLLLFLYLDLPYIFAYVPEKAFEQFIIIVLYNTTAWKLAIIARGENIRQLMREIIERDERGAIKAEFPEEVKGYYKSLTEANDRIFKFLFLSMYTTAFLYFLIYCWEGVHNWETTKLLHVNQTGFRRPLLYMLWMPGNTDDFYAVASVVHIVSFVLAISIIIIGDGVVLTMILYVLCELKVLRYWFRYYEELPRLEGTVAGQSIYENVRWCVMEHQKIIANVEKLDRSIQTLMLLDFLTHSVQLASTLFLLLVMSIRYIWAILYFIYVYFQLFFFYWYGEEIQNQSLGIGESVYESNWYEHNEKVKKLLLMVMVRSQRSLKLHIGPLYDISNEVLFKINKTFYTIVSVLQRGF